MDDLLVLTGDSVSARQVSELARRVADATERHPRFRPIRAGTQEPLRKLKTGFREFLVKEAETSAGRPLRVLFGDPDRDFYGTLNVFPDPELESAPRTHLVDASLPVAGLDTEGRDDFVAWAVDLFDALDVFHGYVTTSGMQAYRKQLIAEAFDRGEIAAPDWADPLYTILDRVVSDVYWVNYFGPAFVDRWGADRFAAIGRPLEARPTGAIVVWATNEPPEVDRSVRRLTAARWKAPFYRALGLDAFTHETLEVPSPGHHVPTLLAHRNRPAGPASR